MGGISVLLTSSVDIELNNVIDYIDKWNDNWSFHIKTKKNIPSLSHLKRGEWYVLSGSECGNVREIRSAIIEYFNWHNGDLQ